MCVAVPGRVVSLREGSDGVLRGDVDFGGAVKDICLAFVPDVRPDDYVIVHLGLALERVEEREAAGMIAELERLGLGAPPEERPT